MDEPNYKVMVSRIGAIIEDTIPEHSEINVVDAVALLVRENDSLRISLGLPTYSEVAARERERSYTWRATYEGLLAAMKG